MTKRLDVVVDDEITETFIGDDLQVELIENTMGTFLKIKKGFNCVGMFVEWRYWRFVDPNQLEGIE